MLGQRPSLHRWGAHSTPHAIPTPLCLASPSQLTPHFPSPVPLVVSSAFFLLKKGDLWGPSPASGLCSLAAGGQEWWLRLTSSPQLPPLGEKPYVSISGNIMPPLSLNVTSLGSSWKGDRVCQTRTRFWFKVRKTWDETPAQPSASCAGKVTHATWASSPHLSHGEMTAANTYRGPGGLPRASWMLIHGILTTSCKVGVAVIIPV